MDSKDRPAGWVTIRHKRLDMSSVDKLDDALTDAFEAGADALIQAGYRQVEEVEGEVMSDDELNKAYDKDIYLDHKPTSWEYLDHNPTSWEIQTGRLRAVAREQLNQLGKIYREV